MNQLLHSAYDTLGRRTAVTNALGQVTHTAYDAEGRAIATWGATYPESGYVGSELIDIVTLT